MKNSIHYSPEAQNDLDEIWEYISFELCNPQATENTVNKIMSTVDELGGATVDYCVIKDDFEKLYKELVRTDGIV